MMTLPELAEKLKRQEETDLLEILEISSEEIVEKFMDKIEEEFDRLEKEFGEDDEDNN